eukprot:6182396-Pleurochrysis_carterae.AAC.2
MGRHGIRIITKSSLSVAACLVRFLSLHTRVTVAAMLAAIAEAVANSVATCGGDKPQGMSYCVCTHISSCRRYASSCAFAAAPDLLLCRLASIPECFICVHPSRICIPFYISACGYA